MKNDRAELSALLLASIGFRSGHIPNGGHGSAFLNATLTGPELKRSRRSMPPGAACSSALPSGLHLSARAFYRVIRVARTIADLAHADAVTTEHLGEALQYRFVERSE